jgi:Putative peptidoglycan binding domain
MAINYQVKQGDCISSIAFEHGFFPDTIWDHPSNAELKKKRIDPNVLMPGDVVFVPDKRLKEVSEPTEQVHKFRYKGVPAKFRIQIMEDNQPRANVPYTLTIDGKVVSNPGDRTTSAGMVICSILPDVREGLLVVGEGEEMVEYTLAMGFLNPVSDLTGVKQRLRNLGLYNGAIDNNLSEETKDSLRAFQALHKLPTTGEPDQATLNKLREIHDGG